MSEKRERESEKRLRRVLGGGLGEKACWERLGFGEQREIVFCSILVFSVVVLSCIL